MATYRASQCATGRRTQHWRESGQHVMGAEQLSRGASPAVPLHTGVDASWSTWLGRPLIDASAHQPGRCRQRWAAPQNRLPVRTFKRARGFPSSAAGAVQARSGPAGAAPTHGARPLDRRRRRHKAEGCLWLVTPFGVRCLGRGARLAQSITAGLVPGSPHRPAAPGPPPRHARGPGAATDVGGLWGLEATAEVDNAGRRCGLAVWPGRFSPASGSAPSGLLDAARAGLACGDEKGTGRTWRIAAGLAASARPLARRQAGSSTQRRQALPAATKQGTGGGAVQ